VKVCECKPVCPCKPVFTRWPGLQDPISKAVRTTNAPRMYRKSSSFDPVQTPKLRAKDGFQELFYRRRRGGAGGPQAKKEKPFWLSRLKSFKESLIKNHVQILHFGVMQILHSLGVHFLHAGGLDAKFSCSPVCEICLSASMRFLPSGLIAKFASRPGGRNCLLASGQALPPGQDAKSARWQGSRNRLRKTCIDPAYRLIEQIVRKGTAQRGDAVSGISALHRWTNKWGISPRAGQRRPALPAPF
jgi:hypothetical protein